MPVVAGGWTEDAGYVEWMDRSGHAKIIMFCVIIEKIKQKMATLEVAGTLSTAEIDLRNAVCGLDAFQNPNHQDLERILQFIRKDAKWSRGLYMPSADITSVLDSQWANILKKWS
jgi:hypothetical protein